MAFGGFKGSLVGGNNSIPNPLPATGSVTVAIGDLIVAVIAQQTANTSTAVSDNLTNTYTAQNAGTLATISGRMYYSRATFAGTLTTVNFATTASSNDASCSVAVYEGPFLTSPLDTTPGNLSADLTTPYSCPASGTLAQAQELIIGWFAAASTAAFTAGGGFTKNVQQSQSANASTSIASLAVSATTTQTPTWTGTAPTADVLGTASFKRDPVVTTTAGAGGTSTLTAATGAATAADAVTAGGTGTASAQGTAVRGVAGRASGYAWTVTQAYQKTYSIASSNNFANATSVSVIAASNLTAVPGGTIARITIQAEAGIFGYSVPIYIGQAAASGDAYDFLNTPARVLFNGTDYVTDFEAGTVYVSDWVTLPEPFDSSKNYCIAANWPIIFTLPWAADNTGDTVYRKAGADAATVNKSGYSLEYSDKSLLVSKIEVQEKWGAVGEAIVATTAAIAVSWVEIEGVEADAVAGAGAGAASGTGSSAATGTAIISDAVSATATGTAQATGASFVARNATAAGTSTTTAATGQAIRYQAVTAAGNGAATATGQSFFAATANAAGTGTATAFGGQVGVNLGLAQGLGVAAATGSSTAAGGMVATATSTATATGQRIVFSAATASATATSTAQASGRAFVAGVANTVGAGAATSASRTTVASIANATGAGAAQGGGQWITAAVAMAAGIGQAQATGLVSTGNVKTQYVIGRRSKQPTITGTKPPPPAIIAQRNTAATWIGQQ